MQTIRNLCIWTWRAWPVLMVGIIGAVHYALVYHYGIDAKGLNKIVSLLAQLAGGGIVLYSIDSNIGTFRKSSLRTMLRSYVAEFPTRKRSITIQASAAGLSFSGGVATVHIRRAATTVDEKLIYLQEQIDTVKVELDRKVGELSADIQRQATEFRTRIQGAESALSGLESKVTEAVAGGIMWQFFGFLLIVYGAVSGYNS